jgi:hypothetical protein
MLYWDTSKSLQTSTTPLSIKPAVLQDLGLTSLSKTLNSSLNNKLRGVHLWSIYKECFLSALVNVTFQLFASLLECLRIATIFWCPTLTVIGNYTPFSQFLAARL